MLAAVAWHVYDQKLDATGAAGVRNALMEAVDGFAGVWGGVLGAWAADCRAAGELGRYLPQRGDFFYFKCPSALV